MNREMKWTFICFRYNTWLICDNFV